MLLHFFGLVLVTEIVMAFIFAAIAQIFYKRQGLDFRSIIKGIIERGFITLSLLNDYPHAITFFSALKLGTRLKHKDLDDASENAFNDFYLVGNLLSVAVAMGYVIVYKRMIGS
jgi:hypothetical protein